MNIKNIGHSMKYEAECIAMLFFPDEKIVTTEYPADEEEHEELLVQQEQKEQKAPVEDCIETRLQNGLMKVTLSLDGKQTSLCRTILSEPHSPYEKAEFVMSDMIYTLLSQATGIHPAWGMVTGVRPVKLFHRRLDEGKTPQMVAREFEQHFYVTQEKIELALETARHEAPILREVTDDTFSLYISIPFCPSRCSYCSFVSHDITSKRAKDILPVYVDRLCEELEQISQKVKGTGLRLTTVYFGGGTPTILSPEQLDQICCAVEQHFDLSQLKEYTVEAGRPDTIDEEKLRVLRRHNISRISINPQTLDDEVLQKIGRRHTAQQVIDCFEMARRMGFDNINMDLIAGLPGDSVEGFCKTVDKVIALQPENVTVHTLSIKRSANYGESWEERRKALEQAQQVGQMVSYAQKQLMQSGWMPYYLYKQRNTLGNLENTGYCKPGCEGRYNIYIMDETQTILAAGAGAVTKLCSNREGKLERIFNYKYPFEYVEQFDEVLKRKDRVVDFFEENRPLPLRKD